MATPNETAIYQQLAALLSGRLDFDDFWDWLRPLQRTIPASDPARKLLFTVIAKLDEYDSSEMTDEQLRRYLSALVPPPPTAIARSFGLFGALRLTVSVQTTGTITQTPPDATPFRKPKLAVS